MVVNFARTSTSANILRQVFQGVDAYSCPQLFNFHMHTVHSDGRLQPTTLIEQAITIGLEGLAITDHHSIDGYYLAQAYLEKIREYSRENTPYLWSGVEINANLMDVEVHILAYAFEPEHPSMKPYVQKKPAVGLEYQADKIIESIHAAGGLAVLAHPARYKRSHAELIPAAAARGIDGVETFYAYNNPKPWKTSPVETQQVQHLAAEYQLLNTCGTDTHGLNLLQRL